jgi:hypothetical protein
MDAVPSTLPPVDFPALLQQLAALAMNAGLPLRVVVECGGRRVELSAGSGNYFADQLPVAEARLIGIERTILEAVAELGGEPKGEAIAERAGYPYDSHLKTALANLRRLGLLGGAKGRTGYPLTGPGRDLIAGLAAEPPHQQEEPA